MFEGYLCKRCRKCFTMKGTINNWWFFTPTKFFFDFFIRIFSTSFVSFLHQSSLKRVGSLLYDHSSPSKCSSKVLSSSLSCSYGELTSSCSLTCDLISCISSNFSSSFSSASLISKSTILHLPTE